MEKPLVSVCIPAYNSAEYIKETIQAVLNQTYRNLELIVIDDCSADNTAELVEQIKDPRVRLVRNEQNLGMTGNWNKCLQEASGDYMKLLCADDILKPESIEYEIKPLLKYPDIDLVSSDTELIDITGKRTGSFKRFPVRGRMSGKRLAKISLMLNNFFGAPCNNLFRREAALKIGGFDEQFPYILDFDMWTNLACHGDVYIIHKELNSFRIRKDSNTGEMIGGKQKKYTEEHRRLVEKYRHSGLLKISAAEVEISVWLRSFRSFVIHYYLKVFSK